MEMPEEPRKAGRATTTGIALSMKGIGGSLALASTVTLGLLGGHGIRPDGGVDFHSG
jgi:hypothetical protein